MSEPTEWTGKEPFSYQMALDLEIRGLLNDLLCQLYDGNQHKARQRLRAEAKDALFGRRKEGNGGTLTDLEAKLSDEIKKQELDGNAVRIKARRALFDGVSVADIEEELTERKAAERNGRLADAEAEQVAEELEK